MAPLLQQLPAWARKAVLTVLALLAVVSITVTITDDPGPDPAHPVHRAKVVIHVDGVDPDHKADDTIVLSPAAQKQLGDLTHVTGDLGDDLSNGAPRQPIDGPLAAQDWPGCRTAFVRNESQRVAGSKVGVIVWHYTVSADTPGWADNDALTARANSLEAGVSWHFQIGRADGNCTYNVPIGMKAWHAAAANSFSVGIEVHATGQEGTYVTGAGERRLLQVTREIGRRTGIPMQRGLVVNCKVVRPGIVRHIDLGLCGGGHVDTSPFPDPIEQLLPKLQAKPVRPVSARDRRDCRGVHAYRARRKAHKPRTAAGSALFEHRLVRVRSHGLRCVDGAVRRRS